MGEAGPPEALRFPRLDSGERFGPPERPSPHEPQAPLEPLSEREIRDRLGVLQGDLTFRQIAIRVGMNAETVRRYLRGGSRIPAVFIARMAASLGVDPAEILLRRGREQRTILAARLTPIIEQLSAIEAEARTGMRL